MTLDEEVSRRGLLAASIGAFALGVASRDPEREGMVAAGGGGGSGNAQFPNPIPADVRAVIESGTTIQLSDPLELNGTLVLNGTLEV